MTELRAIPQTRTRTTRSMAPRCWHMAVVPWNVLFVAVLVVVVAAADGGSKPRSIPSQILRAKIPSLQQQQLWLYEGALFDPLDGRRIATVQGLELVRPVKDTTHLAIDGILKHPNATYEDSKTVWSQKIFCYTTNINTNTDNNNDGETRSSSSESILDSVRIRPRSPRKKVPRDQAIIVYETATTFVARNKTTTLATTIDETNDNQEILVHSEWPNGQTMWGKATRDMQGNRADSAASGASSPRSIDFTVFAKLRNKNSPLYAPDLQQQPPQTSSNKNGDIVVSPKRAALVQFGSSSGKLESKHKYGARETYSYRNLDTEDSTAKTNKGWFASLVGGKRNSKPENDDDGPTLCYTRYGEGPPFYAPGRMCMLELRGRPVRSLREVGPLLKGLLLGSNSDEPARPPLVSNFHWRENNSNSNEEPEISTTTTSSPQAAWNLKQRPRSSGAVASLKNNRPRQRRPFEQPLLLQLADNESTEDDLPVGWWKKVARTTQKRALQARDRIRASTTLEARS